MTGTHATLFGRFVGLVVLLYGGWMAAVNINPEDPMAFYDSNWVRPAAIAFGTLGFLSSLVFLLSLDGPPRWRSTGLRATGWVGMVIALLLPTSITIFVLPLVLVAGLVILAKPPPVHQPRT